MEIEPLASSVLPEVWKKEEGIFLAEIWNRGFMA